MNPSAVLSDPPRIVYPESDGQPMADNTRQLQWIVVLFGNLAALFRNVLDVFVGSNQFWYPVEGQPEIRTAPDVYLVFGRPKGHRSSYQQWLEGNVGITVVFKILSPENTHQEMVEKLTFYEDYGVEEYYVYDPMINHLVIYLRKNDMLRRVRPVQNFSSPRLGIRFDLSEAEMVVYGPDGRRFLSFEELTEAHEREEHLRLAAEQRANQESQRADQESRRAQQAEQRAARLAVLSRKARLQQATPEELVELERLEQQPV